MRKGMSTIIEMVIMMGIVLALASSAYIFVSGSLTKSLSQAFDVKNFEYGDITIQNLGTEPITSTGLKVFVEGSESSIKLDRLNPGEIGIATILDSFNYNGNKKIKVISVSMSVGFLGDFGTNQPEGGNEFLIQEGFGTG